VQSEPKGATVTEQATDSDANQHAAPDADALAGVVTKLSPRSVADTVASLRTLLSDKRLKLFAVIDHSGEASAVGMDLRDTKLVVFGSPQAGTPVMQAAPLAALDLPLKVLVWADREQTKVSYVSPDTLAARYQLGDELAERLGAINALTDALTAG
jgi:uncharacterized protein (DUF302 family)